MNRKTVVISGGDLPHLRRVKIRRRSKNSFVASQKN